jgi:hypothetical protein
MCVASTTESYVKNNVCQQRIHLVLCIGIEGFATERQ